MTTEKFDRHAQLAAARAALAASGKSPRELALEARQNVLQWIYRWGFTSTAILSDLLDKSAGVTVKRLVDQGWLRSTKTRSGTPTAFITLSEQGHEEAIRHADTLLPYPELDPYRVNQQLLRHNLMAQKMTCNALNNGDISWFKTEKELSCDGDQPNIKRPDIVWHYGDQKTAVEIELSPKWQRDLDQFILGIILALQDSESQPSRFDYFVIFSDSPAILSRYQAAMTAGSPLNIWKKDTRGHWSVDKTGTVPKWLVQLTEFRMIEEL